MDEFDQVALAEVFGFPHRKHDEMAPVLKVCVSLRTRLAIGLCVQFIEEFAGFLEGVF